MKLKLTAKIQKTSRLSDEDSFLSSDVIEGLSIFYTSDDDNVAGIKFKSAEKVYDYYSKHDWPEGWDDDIEENFINGGKPIRNVKLIDHGLGGVHGYEVIVRSLKDSDSDEGWEESEIIKIEELRPKIYVKVRELSPDGKPHLKLKAALKNNEIKANEDFFNRILNLLKENGKWAWPDTGALFTKVDGKLQGSPEGLQAVKNIVSPEYFDRHFTS